MRVPANPYRKTVGLVGRFKKEERICRSLFVCDFTL